MARSSRTTIKVVSIATLLASAGAGTYYAMSADNGWIAGLLGRGQLVAEEPAQPLDLATEVAEVPANAAPTKLSQSELDAVAAAWGGKESPQPAVENQPTPIDDQEHVSASEEPSGDRYAASPAEVAPVSESRYANHTEMPVVLPVVPSETVTRGQAPNEYEASEAVEEPAPIAADVEESPVDSSRRAREAFGDQQTAAPAVAASDRYQSPSAAQAAPSRAPSEPQMSNPFAAAAAPAPLAAEPQEAAQYQPANIRTANAAYRTGAAESPNQFGNPADLAAPIESEPAAAAGEGTGKPGERALEGPQKPALMIQKFAPPEIQVNKAAKFAIQIRNVSGQTAENVVIRDEVPKGTRVLNTTPRATSSGSHVVWEIGALSAGEERTVEVELMPLTEGEIGSVAEVTHSTRASAKTRCTMPQLAIRMTAPRQVMVGQEQRVKIELRNPGTGDATGVMLLENVPDNVKHAAGPALEFEIGTLRAGETRELELVLTAEKPGPVINAITARADGNLEVNSEVDFEVIAPALQLSVEGPERRYLERPATYKVVIENPGTAPAHDIELVTKLPKGMQFIKANNMGEYDAGTHAVYWSLAQLPEGEDGSVELVAMPVEPGEQTIEVEGKAQQGLTDEAKQVVTVEGLAALMFEVRDAEDPIEVRGETTYEIRVVNQGSKAATNVKVDVSLTPGIEAISASGETKHRVEAGRVTFDPIPQLAPKTDTTFRVQVKGVQPGDQRVRVEVNSDEFSQSISREESTRVFGDE